MEEKRYPYALSYNSAVYVPRGLDANKNIVACQQDIVAEPVNSLTSSTQAESPVSTPTSLTSGEKTSLAEPTPSAVLDSTAPDFEEDFAGSSKRWRYAVIFFVVVVVAVGLWAWYSGGFRRVKAMLHRADRAQYKRVRDEDLEK